MTTKNPTGFCPRCNQEVLLTREDIDVCLAIILLIFTAGIGLIIYLVWYYSKEENTCVHCGSKITTLKPSSPYTYQFQPQTQQQSYITPVDVSGETKVSGVNFCALCGEKLEFGIKFCPNCGSKITEN